MSRPTDPIIVITPPPPPTGASVTSTPEAKTYLTGAPSYPFEAKGFSSIDEAIAYLTSLKD